MFFALDAAFAALALTTLAGASLADTPPPQLASRQECQGDTRYITLIATDWTAASALDKAGTPAYWSLWGGSPDSNRTKLPFEGEDISERFTLRTYKANDPAFPTWASAWENGAIDLGPKYTCTIEAPTGVPNGVMCWDITLAPPDQDGVVISAPPSGVTANCVIDTTPPPTSLNFV